MSFHLTRVYHANVSLDTTNYATYSDARASSVDTDYCQSKYTVTSHSTWESCSFNVLLSFGVTFIL